MSERFKEKRQHQRIYKNFILSYAIDGKDTAVDVSQINNISLGGTSFISTFAFQKGVHLKLMLKTPFLSEEVALNGTVLDCQEKVPELIFEVRVQFTKVPAASQEVLKKIEVYAAKEI